MNKAIESDVERATSTYFDDLWDDSTDEKASMMVDGNLTSRIRAEGHLMGQTKLHHSTHRELSEGVSFSPIRDVLDVSPQSNPYSVPMGYVLNNEEDEINTYADIGLNDEGDYSLEGTSFDECQQKPSCIIAISRGYDVDASSISSWDAEEKTISINTPETNPKKRTLTNTSPSHLHLDSSTLAKISPQNSSNSNHVPPTLVANSSKNQMEIKPPEVLCLNFDSSTGSNIESPSTTKNEKSSKVQILLTRFMGAPSWVQIVLAFLFGLCCLAVILGVVAVVQPSNRHGSANESMGMSETSSGQGKEVIMFPRNTNDTVHDTNPAPTLYTITASTNPSRTPTFEPTSQTIALTIEPTLLTISPTVEPTILLAESSNKPTQLPKPKKNHQNPGKL